VWPFKQKRKLTFEEYAASRPKAPCGNQLMHVWGELNGLRCYACERIEKSNLENEFVEKIVTIVIERMRDK
jgi:hypothetical protein